MEGFPTVSKLGIYLALMGFIAAVSAASAAQENPSVALWIVLAGFALVLAGSLMFIFGFKNKQGH